MATVSILHQEGTPSVPSEAELASLMAPPNLVWRLGIVLYHEKVGFIATRDTGRTCIYVFISRNDDLQPSGSPIPFRNFQQAAYNVFSELPSSYQYFDHLGTTYAREGYLVLEVHFSTAKQISNCLNGLENKTLTHLLETCLGLFIHNLDDIELNANLVMFSNLDSHLKQVLPDSAEFAFKLAYNSRPSVAVLHMTDPSIYEPIRDSYDQLVKNFPDFFGQTGPVTLFPEPTTDSAQGTSHFTTDTEPDLPSGVPEAVVIPTPSESDSLSSHSIKQKTGNLPPVNLSAADTAKVVPTGSSQETEIVNVEITSQYEGLDHNKPPIRDELPAKDQVSQELSSKDLLNIATDIPPDKYLAVGIYLGLSPTEIERIRYDNVRNSLNIIFGILESAKWASSGNFGRLLACALVQAGLVNVAKQVDPTINPEDIPKSKVLIDDLCLIDGTLRLYDKELAREYIAFKQQQPVSFWIALQKQVSSAVEELLRDYHILLQSTLIGSLVAKVRIRSFHHALQLAQDLASGCFTNLLEGRLKHLGYTGKLGVDFTMWGVPVTPDNCYKLYMKEVLIISATNTKPVTELLHSSPLISQNGNLVPPSIPTCTQQLTQQQASLPYPTAAQQLPQPKTSLPSAPTATQQKVSPLFIPTSILQRKVSLPSTPTATQHLTQKTASLPSPTAAHQFMQQKASLPCPTPAQPLALQKASLPSPTAAEQLPQQQASLPSPTAVQQLAQQKASLPFAPTPAQQLTLQKASLPSPTAAQKFTEQKALLVSPTATEQLPQQEASPPPTAAQEVTQQNASLPPPQQLTQQNDSLPSPTAAQQLAQQQASLPSPTAVQQLTQQKASLPFTPTPAQPLTLQKASLSSPTAAQGLTEQKALLVSTTVAEQLPQQEVSPSPTSAQEVTQQNASLPSPQQLTQQKASESLPPPTAAQQLAQQQASLPSLTAVQQLTQQKASLPFAPTATQQRLQQKVSLPSAPTATQQHPQQKVSLSSTPTAAQELSQQKASLTSLTAAQQLTHQTALLASFLPSMQQERVMPKATQPHHHPQGFRRRQISDDQQPLRTRPGHLRSAQRSVSFDPTLAYQKQLSSSKSSALPTLLIKSGKHLTGTWQSSPPPYSVETGGRPDMEVTYTNPDKLFYFIRKGEYDEVKRLIEAGADLFQMDGGHMPIHVAAYLGKHDIVRLIVQQGCSVEVQTTPKQLTALHLAAYFGQPMVTDTLLKLGAKVDAQNTEELTPLHMAASEGHAEIVQLLLTSGANPMSNCNKRITPLQFAAANGHTAAVRIFLQHVTQTDLTTTDHNGHTAVHAAVLSRNPAILSLILKLYPDILSNPAVVSTVESPLVIACKLDMPEIVEMLLQYKAEPNVSNIKDNLSPLHIAAIKNNWKAVELLVAHGANISYVIPRIGAPLHLAAENGHTQASEKLLQLGADVDILDDQGATPLTKAVECNQVSTTELLVHYGAKVNVSTPEDGFALIHKATKRNNTAILKLLVENGADVKKATPKHSSALHFAAADGNTEAVEFLCSAGCNVSAQNSFGVTPLLAAISKRKFDCAVKILEYKPDITLKDRYDVTALYCATDMRHVEIVEKLLVAGGQSDTPSQNGITPLQLACKRGYSEILELMLKHNPNVILSPIFAETPVIFTACSSGSPNTLRLLLQAGADPNTTSKKLKITPLVHVCQMGHIKMLEDLISFGADPTLNTPMGTTLHVAVGVGNYECAKKLLDLGVDTELVTGPEKVTPLIVAAELNQSREIELLLDYGASLNAAVAGNGYTALHKAASSDLTAAANVLIERGADINMQSTHGLTPLHMAASAGSKGVTIALVEAGCNINIQDNAEVTPLMRAVHDKQEEIAAMLIEYGADVSICRINDGLNVLHIAAQVSSKEIAKKLIEAGAPPDIQEVRGSTPLHIAVSKGDLEFTRLLLSSKASPNSQDMKQVTPLHIAAEMHSLEFVQLLLEYNADHSVRDSSGQTPGELTEDEQIRSLLASKEKSIESQRETSISMQVQVPDVDMQSLALKITNKGLLSQLPASLDIPTNTQRDIESIHGVNRDRALAYLESWQQTRRTRTSVKNELIDILRELGIEL